MDSTSIVHHDDDVLRLVSVGALLLVHIHGRFTHREGLEIHAAQEYLRQTVGRHAIIVLVDDVRTERTELSDRARSLARRTSAEFADSVIGVAHAVEPRGVIGAAVRCIMAAMRAINKPPYPIREFASTRGAAMWLVPLLEAEGIELPIELSAEGLRAWIDAVRAPSSPGRRSSSARAKHGTHGE